MIRVVIDSNVYISGLLFGGNPRTVVELAQQSVIGAFISPAMIQEIEEVLERKFGWRGPRILSAAAATWGAATCVDAEPGLVDCQDPDDNRVLECAVAARARFVVTGDRHLLVLNPYGRCSIVTPRQFLDAAAWLP